MKLFRRGNKRKGNTYRASKSKFNIASIRPTNKKPLFPKQSNTPKYSDLAKERKKKLFQNRISKLNIKINLKYLAILIVILSMGLIIFLSKNVAFNITSVEVVSNESLKEKSENVLNSLIGENIIFLRESNVSDLLKSNIPEIDRVLLYKYLPGKISVEIIQNNPSIIEITLNSVKYLDINAKDKGELEYSEYPSFSEEESQILSGVNLIDSSLVLNKYLEGKTDEEKLLIDWTKVEVSEKQKILKEIKAELENRISVYFNNVKEILKTTPFSDLPVVEILDPNLSLDSTEIKNIILVRDNLFSRNKEISSIVLTSEYSFEVITNSKKVIFSLIRDITAQVVDLDSVIFYGYFDNARIVDLRTETYSIVY